MSSMLYLMEIILMQNTAVTVYLCKILNKCPGGGIVSFSTLVICQIPVCFFKTNSLYIIQSKLSITHV